MKTMHKLICLGCETEIKDDEYFYLTFPPLPSLDGEVFHEGCATKLDLDINVMNDQQILEVFAMKPEIKEAIRHEKA